MATMVTRLSRNTSISTEEALLFLRAFPELRRNPGWMCQQPSDMTSLQWAIHLRYQDEELDAWLRRGSPTAILFANEYGGNPDLMDLVVKKRFYRQVGNIVARKGWDVDDEPLPTNDDWVKKLKNRNLAITALNVWGEIHPYSPKSFVLKKQVDKPLNTNSILKELVSVTAPSSAPPFAWVPANRPVAIYSHEISNIDGDLVCLQHPNHQCEELLQDSDRIVHNYPMIVKQLSLRLEERLLSATPIPFPTPVFDWRFLDLAPSFAKLPIHPNSIGNYIAQGIDGATAMFWISQGLPNAAQMKLATLIAKNTEGVTVPQVAQIITGAFNKDYEINTILAADTLHPGLAIESFHWFSEGWSCETLLRKFPDLRSGQAVTGTPRRVARSSISFTHQLTGIFNWMDQWAAPDNWDEPLRIEAEVTDDCISL